MSIFRKYTMKSLLNNKMRTFMTILGIVLAMALFTAVIEGAYSGISYLRNNERALNGNYHMDLLEADAGIVQELNGNEYVKEYSVWSEQGFAEINSTDGQKPYIRVISVEDNIGSLVPVRIVEGRMPENDGEIVLPVHMLENVEKQYAIGDIIELKIGYREYGDLGVDPNEMLLRDHDNDGNIIIMEKLVRVEEKQFTVVGLCERMNYEIESYSCPGYTALACGATAEKVNVLVELKDITDADDFLMGIKGLYRQLNKHRGLFGLYLITGQNEIIEVIYGMAAILAVIIMVGTVAMLFNAFAISVSERTKQLGILKSVGATGKQIRRMVLNEALILSVIAIPLGLLVGCLGIGAALSLLSESFEVVATRIWGYMSVTEPVNMSVTEPVKMKIIINPAALLTAGGLGLVTAIIAAWVPARRAVKLSPIEAIRQQEDVKIDSGKVRTSALTYRLFGFEGSLASKNFKRNKKKYRITVFSLFISIVLFISSSAFCLYLKEGTSGVANRGNYDADEIFLINDSIYEKLLETDLLETETTDYNYSRVIQGYFSFREENLTDEVNEFFSGMDYIKNGEFESLSPIYLVDDELFERICEDNGLDKNDFYTGEILKGVIYNGISERLSHEGETHLLKGKLLDDDSLPMEVNAIFSIRLENQSETNEMQYGLNEGVSADAEEQQKDSVNMRLCIAAQVENEPYMIVKDSGVIVLPFSRFKELYSNLMPDVGFPEYEGFLAIMGKNKTYSEKIENFFVDKAYFCQYVHIKEKKQLENMVVKIVNVFSYGFIILILLIALTNIFNTVSTNVMLRKREFAMLKSIGLSEKGFRKMMNYECLIYGVKGILWGLPVSFAVTCLIYLVFRRGMTMGFMVPWSSIGIAVGSVFLVIFATMLYATGKIKKENMIDTLKNENN